MRNLTLFCLCMNNYGPRHTQEYAALRARALVAIAQMRLPLSLPLFQKVIRVKM
jgi:hypothetical protein